MVEEEPKISPEWKVLFQLAKGNDLDFDEEPQLDNSLNQKVRWFLSGGACGVLVMIRDIFGKQAVQEFLTFLNDYMDKPDSDGHFHYSDTLMKAIDEIDNECQKVNFKDYLQNLRAELVQEDKNKKRGGAV